jgi:hypothetical protein
MTWTANRSEPWRWCWQGTNASTRSASSSLDVNRFWVPIEVHLIRLAVATDLPVHEIKAALVP